MCVCNNNENSNNKNDNKDNNYYVNNNNNIVIIMIIITKTILTIVILMLIAVVTIRTKTRTNDIIKKSNLRLEDIVNNLCRIWTHPFRLPMCFLNTMHCTHFTVNRFRTSAYLNNHFLILNIKHFFPCVFVLLSHKVVLSREYSYALLQHQWKGM